ncbi:MAG: hypothetical protein ACRENC_09065, partial [Gemmatimonadaceae bacterium]
MSRRSSGIGRHTLGPARRSAAALVLGLAVHLAPSARAQTAPPAASRDGAWIAQHIRATFDSMPPGWVAQQNVMDEIWAPVHVRGVNYFAYGGPATPHAFAARSDPDSPFYQAWFGVYVTAGPAAARADVPMRLGALDQRSWLGAMGDPEPQFQLIGTHRRGKVVVEGIARPLYEWNATTHSDLGPGTTPLATQIGMPPVGQWPHGLTPFHALLLRGYYTYWYDT